MPTIAFWGSRSAQRSEPIITDRRFQFKVVSKVTILMSAGALLWSIGMLAIGAYSLLTVPLCYLVISAASMYLCSISRTSTAGCNLQMSVSIIFPCLFQIVAGGAMATGAVMIWSLVALFSISVYATSREIIKWIIFTLFVLAITVVYENTPLFHFEVILDLNPIYLLIFNSISTYGVILAIGYFFVGTVEKTKRNLGKAVQEVNELNMVLQERNDEHREGLVHARDIQMAFLKSEDHLRTIFTKLFLLRGPRDYVSGDFIWAEQKGDFKYIITGDCSSKGSSHGLLTMLMVSIADRVLQENESSDPGAFLTKMNMSIHDSNSLDLTGIKLDVRLTILVVNAKTNKAKFATAGGGLFVKNALNGTVKKHVLNTNGIGCGDSEVHFSSMDIDLEIGDMVYMLTDGFMDQENQTGEKFGEERFHEILTHLDTEYSFMQKRVLVKEFHQWQEKCEQTDDVLVCGFEIEDPSFVYEEIDELEIYSEAKMDSELD
ncbi:SpoIIE family protein phosphatase [Cryomorpha ignava]|uniref:SpoIIE family protein phosphatase n=1 Tax=Cryomorpha ignava TaxID=101383 RepID=A0A7K3WSM3_9FLAO|nr:SpoIIE family protein phosphatase [Cryomorpha ignava]NEN24528.1 SpoIIE family protein phosphatase [Cryomorpha ignava]